MRREARTVSKDEYERVVNMIGRLKMMVARLERKGGHGCIEAPCLVCDPFQKGDDTWRLGAETDGEKVFLAEGDAHPWAFED